MTLVCIIKKQGHLLPLLIERLPPTTRTNFADVGPELMRVALLDGLLVDSLTVLDDKLLDVLDECDLL